jgi:CBS domain-containing protein
MEPMTLSIDPETDLLTVMRIFVDNGVHAAAVVGEQGEAIGVVSKTDVLGELCEDPGNSLPRTGAAAPEVAAELEARGAQCIYDIMTPLTVAVNESTSLAHAIAVMARSGVHPVPVLSEAGSVTGILSSADVLRWLARSGIYR